MGRAAGCTVGQGARLPIQSRAPACSAWTRSTRLTLSSSSTARRVPAWHRQAKPLRDTRQRFRAEPRAGRHRPDSRAVLQSPPRQPHAAAPLRPRARHFDPATRCGGRATREHRRAHGHRHARPRGAVLPGAARAARLGLSHGGLMPGIQTHAGAGRACARQAAITDA